LYKADTDLFYVGLIF